MDENEIFEYFKKDRFAAENGMKLVKARPGYAEARMEITQSHLNGYGIVQGGATFTLADFAFAAAANAKGFATVSCGASINYFKPPMGRFITAKAIEVSSSRRLCTYNVEIFDEDGSLIARYTGNGYIKKEKAFGE